MRLLNVSVNKIEKPEKKDGTPKRRQILLLSAVVVQA